MPTEQVIVYLIMWGNWLEYDLPVAYGSDAWSSLSGFGLPSALAGCFLRNRRHLALSTWSGECYGLHSTYDLSGLLFVPIQAGDVLAGPQIG
jgi:hypothetical protein